MHHHRGRFAVFLVSKVYCFTKFGCKGTTNFLHFQIFCRKNVEKLHFCRIFNEIYCMKTQKERLFAFIKAIGFSVREFERALGVSNGTVGHLSDTLSANIKEKISTNFQQLNIDWLLTGNGNMLVVPTERTPRDDRETTEQITRDQPRTNQGATKDEPTTEDSSDVALKEKIEELLNTTLAAYKEKIEELQYIIDLQKDYIDGNKNTIAQLEDFIKHLKAENHELKKAQHTVTVPHAKSV